MSLLASDADVMAGAELALRWVHAASGLVWIGTSCGVAWSAGALASAPANAGGLASPDGRRLARTALAVMKHASLWTFGFGVVLLFLLYYTSGDYFHRALTPRAGMRPEVGTWALALGGIVAGVALHRGLARTVGRGAPLVATLLLEAVAVGYGALLIGQLELSHRAAFVHVGALLATALVESLRADVLPAWRAALESGTRADLAVAATRASEAAHVGPAVLGLMLAVHVPWLTGLDAWYVALPTVLVVATLASAAAGRAVRGLGG